MAADCMAFYGRAYGCRRSLVWRTGFHDAKSWRHVCLSAGGLLTCLRISVWLDTVHRNSNGYHSRRGGGICPLSRRAASRCFRTALSYSSAACQHTLCAFTVVGSSGGHPGHRAAYLDKLQGNSLRQDHPEPVYLRKGSGACRSHPGGTYAGCEPCSYTRKPSYVLETSRLYAGERWIDGGHYVWPVRGDLCFSVGLACFRPMPGTTSRLPRER